MINLAMLLEMRGRMLDALREANDNARRAEGALETLAVLIEMAQANEQPEPKDGE